MAYLSREFWKSDDDRQRAASAAPAVGSDLAPGAGSANPVASSGTSQVDPGGSAGAIRSFFDANKDQGSKVLGGLADSISKRIDSQPLGSYSGPYESLTGGVYGGQAYRDAIKNALQNDRQTYAKNQAAVEPLRADVQRFGAGDNIETNQTMLGQAHGGASYTPGQSLLDAWLTASAANKAPATTPQQSLDDLQRRVALGSQFA